MNLPGKFSTEALHTTTLLMYIYRREMNPPGQSSTEACIPLHGLYTYI